MHILGNHYGTNCCYISFTNERNGMKWLCTHVHNGWTVDYDLDVYADNVQPNTLGNHLLNISIVLTCLNYSLNYNTFPEWLFVMLHNRQQTRCVNALSFNTFLFCFVFFYKQSRFPVKVCSQLITIILKDPMATGLKVLLVLLSATCTKLGYTTTDLDTWKLGAQYSIQAHTLATKSGWSRVHMCCAYGPLWTKRL